MGTVGGTIKVIALYLFGIVYFSQADFAQSCDQYFIAGRGAYLPSKLISDYLGKRLLLLCREAIVLYKNTRIFGDINRSG